MQESFGDGDGGAPELVCGALVPMGELAVRLQDRRCVGDKGYNMSKSPLAIGFIMMAALAAALALSRTACAQTTLFVRAGDDTDDIVIVDLTDTSDRLTDFTVSNQVSVRPNSSGGANPQCPADVAMPHNDGVKVNGLLAVIKHWGPYPPI